MSSFVRKTITDWESAHIPGVGTLPGSPGKTLCRSVVDPEYSEISQVRSD